MPAIKTLTFVALSAVIAAHTALADVTVSGHISISRSLADGSFCFDDNNCHDLRPLTDSETSALLQLTKGNTTATTITLPDESSTPAPTTTSSSTRAPITPQIVCYGPYCCDRCYGWKRRRLQTADGIRQLTDAKRVQCVHRDWGLACDDQN